MAEFALILPVMLLIAVAVGDFGRIYASMLTLESATREAADYGAFKESNWADPAAEAATREEMKRRACTAASNLPGYVAEAAPVYCSNPDFEFFYNLEQTSVAGQDPVPIVMARGTFLFTTAVSFPPIPDSVTIVRESRFAVSNLPTTDASPSPDPSIPAPSSIEPPPTESPSPSPSESPSASPSESPSASPSESPSASPSVEPSTSPTPEPTPSAEPTPTPTPEPSPSPSPSQSPSPNPNETPSAEPSP